MIELIRKISEQVNHEKSTQVFFQNILLECLKVTKSSSVFILTTNENNNFDINYHLGIPKEKLSNIKINQDEVQTIINKKEKIIINHHIQESSIIFLKELAKVKSECIITISSEKSFLGFIYFTSTYPQNYKTINIEFLKILRALFILVFNRDQNLKTLQFKENYNQLLLDISHILSSFENPETSIQKVLKLLIEKANFKKGAVIINQDIDKLEIKLFEGYTKEEAQKGKYNTNDGIIGKVYQSKTSISIPKIEESDIFLNKTGSRRKDEKSNYSFFCLPIMTNEKILGIMIFDKIYESETMFEENFNFLKLISSHIAHNLYSYLRREKKKKKLEEENVKLKKALKSINIFGDIHIIGKSISMQQVFDEIRSVSDKNSTVLITGESGTGKELVANSIHAISRRKNQPFVALNCAAISETLIESELFGYERGAFTGATHGKIGKFEAANNGTLFLDEIGEMPIALQSKLLRVLQEKIIDPVGSISPRSINVRVIAATNKNLINEIQQNRFREDLYYRLSTFPINIPPLRERKIDIKLFFEHFFSSYPFEIKENILAKLMQYHWPGNIRELFNVLERAVILCKNNVIDDSHIVFNQIINTANASQNSTEILPITPSNKLNTIDKLIDQYIKEHPTYNMRKYRDFFEKKIIKQSLILNKGVLTKTSKSLEIARDTLKKRIKELDIEITIQVE